MFLYKFLVCKTLYFSVLILLTSNCLISQDDISKDIFSQENYETPYLFNNNQLKPAKAILLKKVINIANWGVKYDKELEKLKKEQQNKLNQKKDKKKIKKLSKTEESKTEESNYRDRVKKELQEKLKNLFQNEDGNNGSDNNETPQNFEQEDDKTKTNTEKELLKKNKFKQSKLQKVISLIQKSSERLPSLFKTKVKKKELVLSAEIDKNIQRIQYQVDVFSKINIKKVITEYDDYGKKIDKKMMETKSFNLPYELWKKCRYNHKGLWILDMSVPYW